MTIAAASWALSMVILQRWLFSDLGYRSLGRLWMYYTSWGDFGFARRSLVGTLLTESRLNRLFGNEYVFGYVFYSLVLTLAYVLLYLAFVKRPTALTQGWLQVAVFFSPAFLTHLGYWTASLDLVVLVLLILAVLFAQRSWLVALLVVSGILTHEVFLFTVPAIVCLKVLQARGEPDGKPLRVGLLLSGAGLLAAGAVGLYGRLDVARGEFERVMADRLPLAIGETGQDAGFFELSSSVADNASIGNRFGSSSVLADTLWASVPTLYALALALVVACLVQASLVMRAFLLTTCLLPIAALAVATDYYRWVSLSASVSLLAILFLYGLRRLSLATWVVVSLASFGLLGPIGAAEWSRPFHMLQLVVDRLLQ